MERHSIRTPLRGRPAYSPVKFDALVLMEGQKHSKGMWAFNGGHSADWDSFEEGLTFVLDGAEPAATMFVKWRAEHKAIWWCGHFQSSFDGGPTLSAGLLERLGAFGVELFIDNYFSGKEQVLHEPAEDRR
jgi:hypothetical protein